MKAHANFVVLAEFYGIDPPTANLELLSRFFVKYPEYKDRVFLSVKVLDDVILQVVLILIFLVSGWHRWPAARKQSRKPAPEVGLVRQGNICRERLIWNPTQRA